MATRNPAHIGNNFDFLRLAAAMCVLFSHQFALSGQAEPLVLGVHTLGGLGVLIFFSISGYLVAASWRADPSVTRFALRRLLRIWPGFAVAVLMCAYVFAPTVATLPLHEYLHDPRLPYYVKNNLMFALREGLPIDFAGSRYPAAIDGSLWTIPLELECYVAVAVLGVVGLLRRRSVVLSGLLLCLVAYAVVQPRGESLVADFQWLKENQYLLEFGLFFFAGTSIQLFEWARPEAPRWRMLAACWVIAVFAYALGRPLLALWLVVPLTTLMIGVRSTPWICRLGVIGDLSFGVYIYAFPVQQMMVHFVLARIGWWPTLMLTTGAVLLLALASWHLIEKRALWLKPRRRARAMAAVVEPGR
jgi:peptidoglycan/LPS O-acetylase OafA/YrhL